MDAHRYRLEIQEHLVFATGAGFYTTIIGCNGSSITQVRA